MYAISPRIIVQGGMYRNLDHDQKQEYIRVTKESAKEGYAMLMVSVETLGAPTRNLFGSNRAKN